jgi:hypothetical protein
LSIASHEVAYNFLQPTTYLAVKFKRLGTRLIRSTLETRYRALQEGGYVLDDGSLKPLRPEYGGDGRMLADALAEARALAGQPDPKGAKAAADRIKAALKRKARAG